MPKDDEHAVKRGCRKRHHICRHMADKYTYSSFKKDKITLRILRVSYTNNWQSIIARNAWIARVNQIRNKDPVVVGTVTRKKDNWRSFNHYTKFVVRNWTTALTTLLSTSPRMKISRRESSIAPKVWKFKRGQTPLFYWPHLPLSDSCLSGWGMIKTVSTKVQRCGCSTYSWKSQPPQIWTNGSK